MNEQNITIGNYHILSNIANGSFGRVYLARHSVLTNRLVAIKLMHAIPLSTKQEYEQFLNEARILEMLHHPYILPILDVGVHEGIPYIVSEYAAGGSLRMRLSEKTCSLEESLTILSQVGQGLYFAHKQKIIHRDLKPENILFNARGFALLADFGLATILSTASVKYVSKAGTPRYMAPEQSNGVVSTQSDQYALGCIAYELLTGLPVFNGTDPLALMYQHTNEKPVPLSHYISQIQDHIEQAVLKALNKQRQERHSDVTAFLTALGIPTDPLLTSVQSNFVHSVNEQAASSTSLSIPVKDGSEKLLEDVPGSKSFPIMPDSTQINSRIPGQGLLPATVPAGPASLSSISDLLPTSPPTYFSSSITILKGNGLSSGPQGEIVPGAKKTSFGSSSQKEVDKSSTGRKRSPAFKWSLVAITCLLIVVVISSVWLIDFQPTHSEKISSGDRHSTPVLTSTSSTSTQPVHSSTATLTPSATAQSTPTVSIVPTATATSNSVSYSQPILSVNNSSINANTECTYDPNHGWVCPVSLHNAQNTQNSLSWNASSQFNNVIGFSQISGTLSPGQTQSINVSVSNISCPSTLSFNFTGPDNKVTVSWHCAAPNLTASPTDLTTEICPQSSLTFQCPVYLNVMQGSEGGLNWTSSGTEYLCDINGCRTGSFPGPITPSTGSIISSANYQQIIVDVSICQHESIKDTIIITGPANSVTITYSCNSST